GDALRRGGRRGFVLEVDAVGKQRACGDEALWAEPGGAELVIGILASKVVQGRLADAPVPLVGFLFDFVKIDGVQSKGLAIVQVRVVSVVPQRKDIEAIQLGIERLLVKRTIQTTSVVF